MFAVTVPLGSVQPVEPPEPEAAPLFLHDTLAMLSTTSINIKAKIVFFMAIIIYVDLLIIEYQWQR
jgi:hypothetical protein